MSTPVIRRRNHGRGHSYTVDGVKLPGATTILGTYPKHLEKWAAEESAWYALGHWDELAELPEKERFKLISEARFASRSEASVRGTDVHRLAAQLIHGDEVEVAEHLKGHVDSCISFLEEWDVKPVIVEAPIANVTRGYCGTLDVIADLVDGHRWLFDYKTSKSGVFRESALQLAAYRYAEWYVDADGQALPMIPVERTGVVWLRADGYDFHPVDAGEREFACFRALQIVHRFGDSDVIGDSLTPNGRAHIGHEPQG